jgi:hypothetical protein
MFCNRERAADRGQQSERQQEKLDKPAMKKQSSSKSGFINSRNLIAVLFCTAGISLVMLNFSATASSRKTTLKQQTTTNLRSVHGPAAPVTPAVSTTPTSGTLTSANIGTSNAINWADSVGTVPNFTFFAGNGTCAAPGTCSTFTVTIDPSVGTASGGYDPTKYQIFVEISWAQAVEDYDTWICSGAGTCTQANVVGSNASTADPEVITFPTSLPAGTYTINAVMTNGGPTPYNGTIYLSPLPTAATCTSGNCTPPRYFNYPAGLGQGDGAGEPSIGVDWNPNVASLKDITSPDFATGTKRLNTGGVAFMTMNGVFPGTTQNGPGGEAEWRVNFDDCPSPAINTWKDVSAIFAQTTTTLVDPIGFVDHYSSAPLGLTYPEPVTPGRVFQLQLNGGQGNSAGAYSDNDGNSYLPGANGGPGQGPDHETLGGGPYNPNSTPPPPPQAVAYGSPNAIYYCSQNIVGEAECSRSDNGGQTFGPGVPIFNPTQCTGGIHGHVKVAADGTVYVPNSSCGANGGTTGVAVSIDNGLTWTQNNISGSFSTQDPSVGIGQNGVGKPAGNLNGTNTIYLGYVDGDGHAKIAHSGNRGVTWSSPADVGISFGVTHGVFPVVVAGDDNRAAFGFLGTGAGISTDGNACDPYGATLNCGNIWHLYIATTYDGGANWITIDATPNDPVQTGTICLQGTLCAGGRNLLDFNGFDIDAEGRGMLGYADGCVNCDNGQTSQSSDAHGTIARQSGGRRLFSHFDPIEPMPPASPQLVSVTSGAGGAMLTWLEPDNGGSPITGYNVYRGGTSAQESFLAHISGETNTKYLDPAPLSGNNFYYAQAINGIGEGDHCGELNLSSCLVNCGTKCTFPYLNEAGAGSAVSGSPISTDPTMGELTIQAVNVGDPFAGNCNEKSITFLMKVQTLDPGGTGMAVPPPNGEWQIVFGVIDTNGNPQRVFVEMDTTQAPQTTPEFSWGREDTSATGGAADNTKCAGATCTSVSGSFTKDGTIIIKLDVSNPLTFSANTLVTTTTPFTWDARNPGTILGTNAKKITGNTILLVGGGAGGAGGGSVQTVQTSVGGTYTTIGNATCDTIPPVAALAATPVTGNAPLAVNFDASASSEPVGACGTINSYTLDFGDGSTPVTQTCGTICPGSAASFSNTYTAPGEYNARLTVKNTNGLVSVNSAQVVISVASVNPPQLSSVSSRMTHGTAGTFDVNLPLSGRRGVECRSSSSLGAGNYTMIFTFVNPVVSVDGANISSGIASVSSTALGPNANQFTVNLSNVNDQQYISVALINAKDSSGAIGTVAGPQMGVLTGDVDSSGRVDSTDVFQVRQNTLQNANSSNFRTDVNATGRVDSTDVFVTRQDTLTALPSTP